MAIISSSLVLVLSITVASSAERADEFFSSQWDEAITWRKDGIDISFVKDHSSRTDIPVPTKDPHW